MEVRYRDSLNDYSSSLSYVNMVKLREKLNKPSSFPCFQLLAFINNFRGHVVKRYTPSSFAIDNTFDVWVMMVTVARNLELFTRNLEATFV